MVCQRPIVGVLRPGLGVHIALLADLISGSRLIRKVSEHHAMAVYQFVFDAPQDVFIQRKDPCCGAERRLHDAAFLHVKTVAAKAVPGV